MENDFNIIENTLSKWPDVNLVAEIHDNSCKRLYNALKSMQSDLDSIGTGDIAGLVGHALQRKTHLQTNSIMSTTWRVPRMSQWPDKSLWEQFGVKVNAQFPEAFLIQANPWIPDWLEDSKKEFPFKDCFLETNRREDVSIAADPCMMDHTPFETYLSPGQRTVIRGIFNSKQDATLLINLPTGSGKSLAFWLPTLLTSGQGNLTLVIVPTVALAKDQERQIQHLLKGYGQRFAWYEGLDKEDRKQIKKNIVNGTQSILFTSPESLSGSLLTSVYESAKKGFLKYFVIDEVHIISQWGNEFRPAFQVISGIRRGLLNNGKTYKFRTLLLTATLTAETYSTICSLYGPSDDIIVLSALHLRPEPSYWIYKADNFLGKKEYVLEIVKNSPMPLLLYTSKRKHTEMWKNYLKDELNMKRVRTFDGSTSPSDREAIINEWVSNEIDVIVATSAFGMGMDKNDVRTIVHACVPETVDRYYQEVGRAGRDGRACASFLIYTSEDIEIAKSLNRDKIISTDKGLLRWETMFSHKQKTRHNDFIGIDLNISPPHITQESQTNTKWNIRTLLLMARSGLIKIESEEPPQIEKKLGESEDEFENRCNEVFHKYFSQCVVQILEQDHQSKEIWESVVEDERKRIIEQNRNNLSLMIKLLSGRHEIASIFKEIYSLPEVDIDPILVCSGCPKCRKDDSPLSDYSIPEVCLPTNYYDKLFTSHNAKLVVYKTPGNSKREKKKWIRTILTLLKLIIPRLDIREICVSSGWMDLKNYRRLYITSSNRFLIHTDIDEEDDLNSLKVSRVTIIEPNDSPVEIPKNLLLLDRPYHILIFQEDVPDYHPDRKLVDTFPHTTIENLEKVYS